MDLPEKPKPTHDSLPAPTLDPEIAHDFSIEDLLIELQDDRELLQKLAQ